MRLVSPALFVQIQVITVVSSKILYCSSAGNVLKQGLSHIFLSVLTDRPKDICRQEIDDSTATFLQDPETQIREIFEPTIEEEKEDVSNLTCDFSEVFRIIRSNLCFASVLFDGARFFISDFAEISMQNLSSR